MSDNRKKLIKNKSTATSQLMLFSFLLLILLGALLLMLPAASADGTATPFEDTLFTAVSATCVTGLVTVDTATHWSMFGQAIILLLIQIGGMGVVTVAMFAVMVSGKKIGLRQRSTMQESISAPQVGGIVKLLGFIITGSLTVELIGAALLMPVFIKDFGAVGIWYAFFHSISAFCNAGFDLMGVRSPFSSLTSYADNAYVGVVIMLLIIIGGIGFLTWNDIKTNKFRLRKYSLQSKIILSVSAVLILVPAVLFFIFEYKGEPFGVRMLHAFFQSVTTRTAGFNTTDLSQLTDAGKAVMTVLMLIGGSPGSTAGGMKTTTVAVLLFAAISVFRRRDDAEAFGRRFPESALRTAGAILFMYLSLSISAGAVISLIEGLPITECLFETSSAVGTVGLTLGITPALSLPSKIILMVLMYLGRVGGLTLIYAALPSQIDTDAKLPQEKLTVG
ncbi:MAG: Trk family potassium uptake protein [Clostridia bacterium]|nr:Trk family potassium uptake protein [Clostridia bacterium]